MSEHFQLNPFSDFGITTYEQFKLYPFLVFGTLKDIESRITQQIEQIKNGFCFGERLIFLSEKGIGKTSTLFFIKDLLTSSHIPCFYYTRLIENREHILESIRINLIKKYPDPDLFDIKFKEAIKDLFSKPTYILIDFPDSYSMSSLKKFLEYIWSLLTSENYSKINFIFAMNEKHHNKIKGISEVLGKFMFMNLQRFDLEETKKLIDSRLKLINRCHKDLFSEEIMQVIFSYSKGIPRNIISACNLLLSSPSQLTKDTVEKVLQDKYIDRVIDDHEEDLDLRRIYKQMVLILKQDFNGCADSQEEYIRKVKEVTGVGRNSIMRNINSLNSKGVFNVMKGGYNRVNKIVSIGDL